MRRLPPLALLLAALAAGCTASNAVPQGRQVAGPPSRPAAPQCDPDDGGLVLPDGFCALVVARDVGAARHLAVAGNGDVFVATGGRIGGGVVALRDTNGDGRADLRRRFGDASGNGIAGLPISAGFAGDASCSEPFCARAASTEASSRRRTQRSSSGGGCTSTRRANRSSSEDISGLLSLPPARSDRLRRAGLPDGGGLATVAGGRRRS